MSGNTNEQRPDPQGTEWRRRGAEDAKDARFDPPADPDARVAYEAGYYASTEVTP